MMDRNAIAADVGTFTIGLLRQLVEYRDTLMLFVTPCIRFVALEALPDPRDLGMLLGPEGIHARLIGRLLSVYALNRSDGGTSADFWVGDPGRVDTTGLDPVVSGDAPRQFVEVIERFVRTISRGGTSYVNAVLGDGETMIHIHPSSGGEYARICGREGNIIIALHDLAGLVSRAQCYRYRIELDAPDESEEATRP